MLEWLSADLILALAVILASLLLLIFFAWLEKNNLGRSQLAQIDRMDGRLFERYLAELFKKQGFRVATTNTVGDYGGDLILEKDGVKTLVQAKRYSTKVGLKAVQEVVAGKSHYHCKRAMVVTNNFFTPAAKSLARSNYVTLWNRHKLYQVINAVGNSKQKRTL